MRLFSRGYFIGFVISRRRSTEYGAILDVTSRPPLPLYNVKNAFTRRQATSRQLSLR